MIQYVTVEDRSIRRSIWLHWMLLQCQSCTYMLTIEAALLCDYTVTNRLLIQLVSVSSTVFLTFVVREWCASPKTTVKCAKNRTGVVWKCCIFAWCQQRTSLCRSAVTSPRRQWKWCATSASILMLRWQLNIMSTVIRATVSFSSVDFVRSDVRTSPRYWRHKKAIVSTFVLSRLDYCNAAQYGLPQTTLQPLQRALNADARLVANLGSRDHITPAELLCKWWTQNVIVYVYVCI